jgi:hypothetical protein
VLDNHEHQLIVTVCSNPPEGHAGWTVRLVAEEAEKRKLTPSLRRKTILVPLLSHNLKRWPEKMWEVADLDEDYITKIEDVLETYKQAYDPPQPAVSPDEKPLTLHADVRPTSPVQPGWEARCDNDYKRCGTASVFCAMEPGAGRYFTFPTGSFSLRVGSDRRQLGLGATRQPKTIHLVTDNLNIHRRSLTEVFGAEMASEVWNRLTVHYTPTHGSWLNQAETEIGIFARQCPGNRRILISRPTPRSEGVESSDESRRHQDSSESSIAKLPAKNSVIKENPSCVQ